MKTVGAFLIITSIAAQALALLVLAIGDMPREAVFFLQAISSDWMFFIAGIVLFAAGNLQRQIRVTGIIGRNVGRQSAAISHDSVVYHKYYGPGVVAGLANDLVIVDFERGERANVGAIDLTLGDEQTP